MYESFFQLNARPFTALPEVGAYFPGESIEQARQRLTRCLERAEGIALVVGAAGTGKSLLCRVIAREMSDRFKIVLLRGGDVTSRRSLFQAILRALELPFRLDEGELRLSLIDYVEHGASQSQGLLILVDEAQTLPISLLEELRFLSNLQRGDSPWVRLALLGGPELEERFSSPKLEAFGQRLAARSYLQPFDKNETRAYVRARVAACGGNAEAIFADDAFAQIQTAADGVPRRINQVCDHALVLAFAGGKRQINGAGIEEAWADLQQLPLPVAPRRLDTMVESHEIVEFGSLSDEEDTPQMFVSVPTPQPVPTVEIAAHAPRQIERIEAHLDKIEQEYRGNPAKAAGMRFAFQEPSDKHVDAFEQEELLVDRYSKLDAVKRPATTGGALGSLWPPMPLSARAVETIASGRATPRAKDADESIDDDMIVLEDDVDTLPMSSAARPTVQRREYGQLFAKLRRG